jgi:hypothetical protein
MSRYLLFDNYDGTLGGRLPLPAGPDDVSSPGGLSDIQHHWTGGMFGMQERTYDVYAGTGDRYPAGEYGNLYRPNSHGDVHSYYRGPDTGKTENQTMVGDPYFWNNKSETTPPNKFPGIIEGYQPSNTHRNYEKASGPIQQNNIAPLPVESENQGFELIQNPGEPKPEMSIPQTNKNTKRKGKGSCGIPKEDNYTPVDLTPPKKKGGKVCISLMSTSKKWTVVILILILVIATIACNFWNDAVHKYISSILGKDIGWKNYILYAVVTTVILFFVTYNLGAAHDLEND